MCRNVQELSGRTYIENHLPMNDLAFTLYLNTKCKPENVPEELRELYRYINLQKKAGKLAAYDGQDKFVREIHTKVQELNAGRGLSSVMTWEQETRRQVRRAREEGEEKGKKEGVEETLLDNIRALMESLSLNAEQAMEALKVPPEQHKELLAKL